MTSICSLGITKRNSPPAAHAGSGVLAKEARR